MLGGKAAVGSAATARAAGLPGPTPAPGAGPAHPGRGAPTRPMDVSEFLNKGAGAAQLPRKAQDRKEREKSKRALGQSTHKSWKSEVGRGRLEPFTPEP